MMNQGLIEYLKMQVETKRLTEEKVIEKYPEMEEYLR